MKTHRTKVAVVFVVLLSALGVFSDSQIHAMQADKGEDRTLTTGDGWPIHVTYYESKGGKESPVAILIPGVEGVEKSMTRKVWDGVAQALNKRGYAVITADLRKHGDSMPPGDENTQLSKLAQADYQLMVIQDLEAIKDFLVKEHQSEKLNIRKLGIAAAGSSCIVASAFALNDWSKKPWPDAPVLALRTPKGQDVRAIMMLSPKSPVRGINTTAMMRGIADPLKGIAVNVYYNPSDRTETRTAESIFKFLKLKNAPDEDARKIIEGPPDKKYSAEGLLQGQAKTVMETNIAEFFDKYVKQREDPWKTRTSKLQQ